MTSALNHNHPLRVVDAREVSRMSDEEFAALLDSSRTHQVILTDFDEATGKTLACVVMPLDALTHVLEELPSSKSEG